MFALVGSYTFKGHVSTNLAYQLTLPSPTIIVYVIFHRLQSRLSDRNYGCKRGPRFSANFQYNILLLPKCFVSGLCPGPHWGGGAYSTADPQLGNVGSHPRRGPHRIAGPRAPRPHDPPLGQERNNCEHNTRKHGRSGQSKHAKYRSIA